MSHSVLSRIALGFVFALSEVEVGADDFLDEEEEQG